MTKLLFISFLSRKFLTLLGFCNPWWPHLQPVFLLPQRRQSGQQGSRGENNKLLDLSTEQQDSRGENNKFLDHYTEQQGSQGKNNKLLDHSTG